jgi:hypothetical protein
LRDSGCQLGDRRRIEDRSHLEVGIECGVDRGDHPQRRQGIPAKIEERILDPHTFESEDMGVDPGDGLLNPVRRIAVAMRGHSRRG